jgi:pyruvate ferredoxin oxidoreductase beta subunit
MSLDYVKFSNGFEKFMPKEYRDMVEHGPFGKKTAVSQMGTFKEILEEHPMCAGCAMTLFIRLAIIAFPNPEDTITVGTALSTPLIEAPDRLSRRSRRKVIRR